ncbi:hypothetical protein RclHR1_03840005 [Rhizophagus clarus]|uniref:BTB/POZ protein n=1 Tax=Rhizophagus clarus TaxID=94130 RepID=A0A2Z6RH38_9GLOM|nr:hypothetical protein RclHR1_03840005 [Rhizophagus clarus]GES96413.1 BTB/POZ protein [Rhizophagus clarus]
MDGNKLLRKLSQNLLEILDDDEYCDIIIKVGDGDPYVNIFRAHMAILNYRSPYFRRILSTNKKKNDNTLVEIKLSNILPEIFQVILSYIYSGRISLKNYDILDIIKILNAANELSLQELVIYIQSFLINNKTNWLEQNFYLIYQTSFENDSFLGLQKYCTDLMSRDSDKIFESLDIPSIPEKIFISLIQNDKLQMGVIQVWEYVLKWGLAQNPNLSSDSSNYSKDDFNTLKNTLKQCIPFIRFYDLTSKEFSDHILPYREILPEELYIDLLKSFLNLHPDSKLINPSKPHIVKEINPSQHDINKSIGMFDHIPDRSMKRRIRKERKRLKKLMNLDEVKIRLRSCDREELINNAWSAKVRIKNSWDTEEHIKDTWGIEERLESTWDTEEPSKITLEQSNGGWNELPVKEQSNVGGWQVQSNMGGWDESPAQVQFTTGGWDESPAQVQSGWDESPEQVQSEWNESPVIVQEQSNVGGWDVTNVGGWDVASYQPTKSMREQPTKVKLDVEQPAEGTWGEPKDADTSLLNKVSSTYSDIVSGFVEKMNTQKSTNVGKSDTKKKKKKKK